MTSSTAATTVQRAFGPAAQRWLAEHRVNGSILCADLDGAVEALDAAFALRLAGHRFLSAIVLDDPESVVAAQVTQMTITSNPQPDYLTNVLDTLAGRGVTIGGVSQKDVCTFPMREMMTLGTFGRLGDAFAADSGAVAQRIRNILRNYRPRFERVGLGWACDVPRELPARRPQQVVLWAPALTVDRLYLHLMALETTRFPIVVVCAQEGRLGGSRAAFVSPAAAAEALAGAICVVDATTQSPAAACALASLGVPVAAASTSGANEFLNVTLYDPWDRLSIVAALESARGLPASTTLEIDPAQPKAIESGTSLVSVIVPTYRRPQLLPVTLESIRRQTHPNVETIVVNDGAESVSAVVAPFPRTQLIELPENRGLPAARNAGARAAKGRYLFFLDDDDVIFPDCLAMLSGALERSGAALAHGDTVATYVEADGDAYRLIGFEAGFVRPFHREKFLVENFVPVHGWMLERAAFNAENGFDESLPALEDWELFLRLTATHEPIHVDWIGSAYVQRHDSTSMLHASSNNQLELHKKIYARFPVNGAPAIEAQRQVRLAELEKPAPVAAPPLRITPRPWPPATLAL